MFSQKSPTTAQDQNELSILLTALYTSQPLSSYPKTLSCSGLAPTNPLYISHYSFPESYFCLTLTFKQGIPQCLQIFMWSFSTFFFLDVTKSIILTIISYQRAPHPVP